MSEKENIASQALPESFHEFNPDATSIQELEKKFRNGASFEDMVEVYVNEEGLLKTIALKGFGNTTGLRFDSSTAIALILETAGLQDPRGVEGEKEPVSKNGFTARMNSDLLVSDMEIVVWINEREKKIKVDRSRFIANVLVSNAPLPETKMYKFENKPPVRWDGSVFTFLPSAGKKERKLIPPKPDGCRHHFLIGPPHHRYNTQGHCKNCRVERKFETDPSEGYYNRYSKAKLLEKDFKTDTQVMIKKDQIDKLETDNRPSVSS